MTRRGAWVLLVLLLLPVVTGIALAQEPLPPVPPDPGLPGAPGAPGPPGPPDRRDPLALLARSSSGWTRTWR